MNTEWFFQQLEEWANRDDDSPCDPECLAEVRSKAIQCVYAKDHTELARLHTLLSTIGAKISRRLAKQKIPPAVIQAAEIPMLAAMVHGTLFLMEKEDPAQAVQLISHGSTVLAILMNEAGTLNLEKIQQRWPKGRKPSVATISRTIAALEEAGFLQRTGNTRGRKFRILAKARQWRDLQANDQPARADIAIQKQTAPRSRSNRQPSHHINDIPGDIFFNQVIRGRSAEMTH